MAATRASGPILELFAVPDLFASGALEIEHLNGNVRVTFYVERRVGSQKEPPARVPVCSLVMSADDCQRTGAEMQAASIEPGIPVDNIALFTRDGH